MSRNRKHQTAAVRFGPVLKALSMCVFLGGSGVGYVWQKDQINTLAERLTHDEKRYDKLRADNERLARILATLQSHTEIEAQIKKADLGLAAPQPEHIVRLIETPLAGEAPGSSGPWYAGQPTGSWRQP